MTAEIKEAISKKPDNVLFAGFVKSDELRDGILWGRRIFVYEL